MGSKIKLGELLSTLTDYHANGAYKKLKENVELLDEPDFAVMIRTTNFEQEDFSNNVKYISKHAYEFLAKSKVYPNDIIMNKIANAGSSYLMPDLKTPVSLAMNLFLLRIDDTKANPIYIYIYLKINEAYVKSFANGSVTKTITKDAVKNLEIELPNRAIQDQVVAQFTCINDKIILNRQINQTLEQISQTLFKSWFVDFDPVIDNALDAGNPIPEALRSRAELRQKVRNSADFKPLPANIRALFPTEFEEMELGLIPKGWKFSNVGSLLKNTIGGDWGSDSEDEKHTTQAMIVRGTDIPELISGKLSSAPYRWVEPKKLEKRRINVGDIIIEVSGGSPTQSTGRSIFMTEQIIDRLGGVVEPASFCRKFEPLSVELGLIISLHLSKIYNDGKMWEYQNQSTGIANFQTKYFLEAEQIVIPSAQVINAFYRIVMPWIDKSHNNEQIILGNLRDTLLPKLISGELSLEDLPDLVTQTEPA
ncbi:restriction endonuclease subunit S [Klebsiella michiganensis]|uniref:restriction endonuclease subunit S n=1 Tax=Klebsiella michiganensis TaxID=1134687 RepID=UPI001118A6C3|nr:restriction endonuclease subunit S [Klebsiella michiganensis]ELC0837207.1 restriction endonuclease subunit S [Klebsiella michiganensis]ELF4771107.1 restriction endonuclease subunit S [Klebsiella michiganensis]ELP0294329.1 restriction endonuclease subunit S [Klebsiella michiganensis]MBK4128422.1 restriction endonuclease subunit S [Klebsiella michiganensis]MCW9515054.1 restriction endonuclease subunit S [Klebsiella michiganensis]